MIKLDEIRYISLEEALVIHQKTVEHSGGGTTTILNKGQLESLLRHIQNDDYYPTFLDKITHLFFGICKYHCFADGNKRLAISITAQFLLANGFLGIANTYFRKTENISYHVAAGHIDKNLLRRILKAIFNNTIDTDESLKLEILLAESKEDSPY